MELKDEDIKKALECCGCGVTKCVCNECPIRYRESCLDDLPKIALNLINRQQAENEQLQRNLKQCENGYSQELHLARCKIEELKSLCTSEDKLIKELRAEIKQAKSEAIKEFAERLKEKQQTFIGDGYAYEFIPSIEIDVLLAEMVGGEYA